MKLLKLTVAMLGIMTASSSLASTYKEEMNLGSRKMIAISVPLTDTADKPAPGIKTKPIYSSQGNLAVGEQDVLFQLGGDSEITIEVAGHQLSPGSQIRFKATSDHNGTIHLPVRPMKDGEEGKINYKLIIEGIYSELDVDPTVTIGSVTVPEGNGESYAEVKVQLDMHAGRTTSVKYITKDVNAVSRAGEAKNLAYDQFGNPFISVVDNPAGGRLVFDGGFPKFYNQYFTNPNVVGDQWKYLTNVVKWLSYKNIGGGILLLGDADITTNYSVKDSGGGDFNTSFRNWAQYAGVSLTIRDNADFGGGGGKVANVPLSFLTQFDVVIVMGSEHRYGKSSFTEATHQAFGEYSKLGGGIMLITDHHGYQNSVNGIAKQFNAKFYGTVNRSSVTVEELRRKYGDHELWNGLTVIQAGGSEGNVDISAIDVNNIDYEGQGGKITFLEGETEKTLKVKILGDTKKEPQKKFEILLSDPNGLVLHDSNKVGTVTINDDD